MRVKLKTLTGRLLDIELDPSLPINRVKDEVHRQFPLIPREHQRLIFRGKELGIHSGETLFSAGVRDGSFLVVAVAFPSKRVLASERKDKEKTLAPAPPRTPLVAAVTPTDTTPALKTPGTLPAKAKSPAASPSSIRLASPLLSASAGRGMPPPAPPGPFIVSPPMPPPLSTDSLRNHLQDLMSRLTDLNTSVTSLQQATLGGAPTEEGMGVAGETHAEETWTSGAREREKPISEKKASKKKEEKKASKKGYERKNKSKKILASATSAILVDPLALQQLTDMGFPEQKCRRALRLHRNNTQEAMEWLLENGDNDEDDGSGGEASDRMDTGTKKTDAEEANSDEEEEEDAMLGTRIGEKEKEKREKEKSVEADRDSNGEKKLHTEDEDDDEEEEEDIVESEEEDFEGALLRIVRTLASGGGAALLQSGDTALFTPDPMAARRLMEMGFGETDVTAALRATNNNHDAAAAWLLGDREAAENDAEEEQEVIRTLLSNPAVQAGLANPRVVAAMQDILSNPESVRNYTNDPEVGPLLLKLQQLLKEGEE